MLRYLFVIFTISRLAGASGLFASEAALCSVSMLEEVKPVVVNQGRDLAWNRYYGKVVTINSVAQLVAPTLLFSKDANELFDQVRKGKQEDGKGGAIFAFLSPGEDFYVLGYVSAATFGPTFDRMRGTAASRRVNDLVFIRGASSSIEPMTAADIAAISQVSRALPNPITYRVIVVPSDNDKFVFLRTLQSP